MSASIDKSNKQCKCVNCIFAETLTDSTKVCAYEYSTTKHKKFVVDDDTCNNFALTKEDAKSCKTCRYAIVKANDKCNCAFFSSQEEHPLFDDWSCATYDRKTQKV